MGQDRYVVETMESFEEHLKENGVDFKATKFFLGEELTLDPVTERSTSEEANQLFTRKYREGFVLPELA
jgi:hypothetical protein